MTFMSYWTHSKDVDQSWTTFSLITENWSMCWRTQTGCSCSVCFRVRKKAIIETEFTYKSEPDLYLLSWHNVKRISFLEAILEAGRCVFGIQTRRQHSCCGSAKRFEHLWSDNTNETGIKNRFPAWTFLSLREGNGLQCLCWCYIQHNSLCTF